MPELNCVVIPKKKKELNCVCGNGGPIQISTIIGVGIQFNLNCV